MEKKFVWTGDKMKAIIVKRENKKPLLLWEEVPDIQCKPDEVLIDIKATAAHAYVRENRNTGKVILEVTAAG